MEQRLITDRISYLPASSNPLSADVGIIEGDEFIYLFDVGADEAVAEFLEHLPKERKLILSHFHPDHMKNIGRLAYTECYVGANTANYLKKYVSFTEQKGLAKEARPKEEKEREAVFMMGKYKIAERPVTISDGITLSIFPMPSSHAKGSLAVCADGKYAFLGDAAYCTEKKGRAVYNAQLLREQIGLLRTLSADYLLLSHAETFVRKKEEVLRELEAVYSRRKAGEPYIAADSEEP